MIHKMLCTKNGTDGSNRYQVLFFPFFVINLSLLYFHVKFEIQIR